MDYTILPQFSFLPKSLTQTHLVMCAQIFFVSVLVAALNFVDITDKKDVGDPRLRSKS